MAAKMHRDKFPPDWQGDAMVRGGYAHAQDMQGHRASFDVRQPAPSVEQTMRDVQAEELRQAQLQEAERLPPPPPGPGQPGGPPLP